MITSTSNQQMKNLLQLQKKSKTRTEQDAFIVEGIRMHREIPGKYHKKTYVSASFFEKPEHQELLNGTTYEVVDDRVFAAVSDTKTPQGILSMVRQFHYTEEEVLAGACPLLLVLENIQDPGNLGTIIRTAEGAGVTGILMSKDTVDIYNPKTIRSTMGSLYRMPFLYCDDLSAVVGNLKKKDILVYAAHLKGNLEYDEADYRKPAAFLIGNEGNGLTEEMAELANCYIKISMGGQVESLNASIAAAILMYEARRQRK